MRDYEYKEKRGFVLQKDFRILAAFSDSISSVVGQKASDPILFESLLMGAPTRNRGQSLCFFIPNGGAASHTLVCPSPGFVEALLTTGLGLVP